MTLVWEANNQHPKVLSSIFAAKSGISSSAEASGAGGTFIFLYLQHMRNLTSLTSET
jgi:hypothetical protein